MGQEVLEAEMLDALAKVETLPKGDLAFGLSGGKDSTATYLYLLETGFIERWEAGGGRILRVFSDTGWELQETYDYLDRLERQFGKIHRVATWVPGPGEAKPAGFDQNRNALAKLFEVRLGRYCPMVRLILHWAKFPSSVRKWCTEDLKQVPTISFLATLNNPINTIGVRAEESKKRAVFPALHWSDVYDCWTYRPIKHFKLADVIAIHKRHGIAPNPLYLQGAGSGRVGCGPCVNSGKEDLMWLAANHHGRLDLLADLEVVLEGVDSARSRAGFDGPKWFIGAALDGSGQTPIPVATAVDWSKTARGGRQHVLFQPHKEGCAEWGLCEAMPKKRGTS